MTDSGTQVSLTWQTTLADLLTLLLVFVITERCNLLPNSSSSLNKSGDAQVQSPHIYGTDLADYNPLERLTYLISCEEIGSGKQASLRSDLATLRDTRGITRISILHSQDKCARSISQMIDTTLQKKVFFGRASTKSNVVTVLVDVRNQHG